MTTCRIFLEDIPLIHHSALSRTIKDDVLNIAAGVAALQVSQKGGSMLGHYLL